MNTHNKSLLSDLIILAKADDRITHSEYDFIMRLADRMDVSSDEVRRLFDDPLPSKKSFTEFERITHFHRLVLLMNVDRETHEKEVIALRNFGLHMGIRPGAIDRILNEMEQYDDKIIPSHELLGIFQTYYN
ncbi:MAG: TerB family tellurite resistance protein [Flavobacteriaceae bacterium]|nr:TerB family tellurite resistance protein [Flavobacteriaceae bacterium]